MDKPTGCKELKVGADLSLYSLADAIEEVGFTDYYELVVNCPQEYVVACMFANQLKGYFDIRPVLHQPAETDYNKRHHWYLVGRNEVIVYSAGP